jgi:hypothetical protein
MIEWCRQHDDECSKIADAGQALAKSMTIDTELPAAIRWINQRLG